MNDKLKFSTDVSRFKSEISDMRNDMTLQGLLSSACKQETSVASLQWAESQIRDKALEFITYDDRFAGFSKLFPIDNDADGNIYSVGIAVLEHFRGLGIAKKTLEKRLATLTATDCIVTSIKKDNKPSLSLFSSLGFQVLPTSCFRGIEVFSSAWTLVVLNI